MGIWARFLSYADAAPYVPIFFAVNNGALIQTTTPYLEYYRDEIRRLNQEIRKYVKRFSKQLSGDMRNSQLLSLIFAKFLIYRLIGEIDKGWEEFDKDIRHYDNEFFYLRGGLRKRGLDKIAIAELKQKIIESLQKKR